MKYVLIYRERKEQKDEKDGITFYTDPSSFLIHSFIVRAFSIVSRVVKVFETITTVWEKDVNKKWYWFKGNSRAKLKIDNVYQEWSQDSTL